MQKENRLFVACIMALVATSFGFGARLLLLDDIGREFNLDETQKGALQSAGLFPFALSIIFFSLFLDRIGYGVGMAFAFFGHVISAVLTITAKDYNMVYIGTLLFALANGAVEAVINPVTATLYPKTKTHHLNVLHAGWPGGMALGMALVILLPGVDWKVRLGLFLIPTVVYGIMMLGQKFPVQERVAAGVSYLDMMKEFGWASCLIVTFFTVLAFDTVLTSLGFYKSTDTIWFIAAALAAVVTLGFGVVVRSFGQPLFVFLLLVMILLATTELGVDSWMGSIMQAVVSKEVGSWIPVMTACIMFVLRFCAGPIIHAISPLGLLCVCAGMASVALFGISQVPAAATGLIFLFAALYGVGKTFFWPTTLGVVCEQFPKGGAMTINAIAGVGMISVGVIGGSFLGTLQDVDLDSKLAQKNSALHQRVVTTESKKSFLMSYKPYDQARIKTLPDADQKEVEGVVKQVKQGVMAKFAILPAIMFVCYVGLILYFKSKGGYKQVELATASAEGGGGKTG
jgi:MFS family permease